MAGEDLSYRPCGHHGAEPSAWFGSACAPRRARQPEGPGSWWQDAQGGIDAERTRQGALRELEEETGIRSVPMLAETRGGTLRPAEHLRPKAWGGRYRGQKRSGSRVRFLGRRRGRDRARPATRRSFERWRLGDIGELLG